MNLLLIDEPYLRNTYYELLGDRVPERSERLDYEALMKWVDGGLGSSDGLMASIYINIPDTPRAKISMLGWIAWLKSVGYNVWARPKQGKDGDIDEAMVQHLRAAVDAHQCPDCPTITMVSGDAQRWLEYLEEIRKGHGLSVNVVAFTENAAGLAYSEHITFFDVETIPGFVPNPIPNRIRLHNLPPEGAWV